MADMKLRHVIDTLRPLCQQNRQLEVHNLINMVVVGMELVEHFYDSSGAERKELVLEGLKVAIQECVPESEYRKGLIGVISEDIPNIIDLIIAASKGKLQLNKWWMRIQALFLPCWRALFAEK